MHLTLKHTDPGYGVFVLIPGTDNNIGELQMYIHRHQNLKGTEGVGLPLADPGEGMSRYKDIGSFWHRGCPEDSAI